LKEVSRQSHLAMRSRRCSPHMLSWVIQAVLVILPIDKFTICSFSPSSTRSILRLSTCLRLLVWTWVTVDRLKSLIQLQCLWKSNVNLWTRATQSKKLLNKLRKNSAKHSISKKRSWEYWEDLLLILMEARAILTASNKLLSLKAPWKWRDLNVICQSTYVLKRSGKENWIANRKDKKAKMVTVHSKDNQLKTFWILRLKLYTSTLIPLLNMNLCYMKLWKTPLLQIKIEKAWPQFKKDSWPEPRDFCRFSISARTFMMVSRTCQIRKLLERSVRHQQNLRSLHRLFWRSWRNTEYSLMIRVMSFTLPLKMSMCALSFKRMMLLSVWLSCRLISNLSIPKSLRRCASRVIF